MDAFEKVFSVLVINLGCFFKMMALQGETSCRNDARQRDDMLVLLPPQLVTSCDQCQTIARTCYYRASGRLNTRCVTTNAANLVQSWRHRRFGQIDTIEHQLLGGSSSSRASGLKNHKTTIRAVDNLVNHLRGRPTFGFAFGLALLTTISLVFSPTTTTTKTTLASPVGSSTGSLQNDCNSEPSRALTLESRACDTLIMLKCVVVPLYDRYLSIYHNGEPAASIGGDNKVASDLNHMNQVIDRFVNKALIVLNLREFCAFSTFFKLSELKELAGDNQLLTIAYDLVAIELHSSCIEQTIAKLPSVPHLVRDIVKIYIDGADKPLPDLNAPALIDMDLDDDTPFDADAAIQKNGSLEQVVGLSLTMFDSSGNNSNTAQEFRTTCKNFLIAIEQRWDTMEMMNTMVATDGNAIKQMNNFALRALAPTKFADACSKISMRS